MLNPRIAAAKNIPDALALAGDVFGKLEAIRFKKTPVDKFSGVYSFEELPPLFRTVGTTLIQKYGVKPCQNVGFISENRLEYNLGDAGVLCIGGTAWGLYDYDVKNIEVVEYKLCDSETEILITSPTFLENVRSVVRGGMTPLKQIIVMDTPFDDIKYQNNETPFSDILKNGAADDALIDSRMKDVSRENVARLIYTSGTTGNPKGVELLHRSWAYEGAAMAYLDFVHEDDVLYLWLPLSHVFGRDLISVQLSIGFRSVVDGRVDHIVDGLALTHPTILVGVPRIFEKVRAAVMTMYPQNGVKGRISRWAFKVGRESRPYRLAGRPLPRVLRLQYAVADKLVFSKLKARLGGRMRFMISGSAKLSRQVQEWFYSADITIVEGFGATETAAITFLNLPDRPRFGTVGPVIPGLQTKLDDDGEVLVSGPTIARGYHHLPEETREAFDDGWYRTGDIGVLDSDGYLTITDRKKDLFKTSNGKFVAPQKIENAVMANIPYVSQVVAIGQDRKFVSALITLDEPQLRKWAERRGKENMSYAELTQDPAIHASIDRFMRKVNTRLERWEQIKRYTILPAELSMADGTLTPSLKVRRDEVNSAYADAINAMYADDAPMSDLVPR